MHAIPPCLQMRPFTRSQARDAGLSSRVLQGRRFARIHPGVWWLAGKTLAFEHSVLAASLALPDGARTTGLTRIQQLGLDFGPRGPLRFVVQGDHHLVLAGVFLHRTVLMPPCDDVGVSPGAAFVAYCAEARIVDAIKVGDWLLAHEHLTIEEVEDVVREQPWRRGAAEAGWILPHLDAGSCSLPESELRVLLCFAGLPVPVVNASVRIDDRTWLTPDLWYAEPEVAVEYEGEQHQSDRGQYVGDIDRYRLYRRAGIRYVLVTREHLRSPRSVVREVHRELGRAGSAAPPPVFGATWDSLFGPISAVVRRRPRPR